MNSATPIDGLAISKYTCWEEGAPRRSSLGFTVVPDKKVPPPYKPLPRLWKGPLTTILREYQEAYQTR